MFPADAMPAAYLEEQWAAERRRKEQAKAAASTTTGNTSSFGRTTQKQMSSGCNTPAGTANNTPMPSPNASLQNSGFFGFFSSWGQKVDGCAVNSASSSAQSSAQSSPNLKPASTPKLTDAQRYKAFREREVLASDFPPLN